jgi:hypothetical protein
MTKTSIARPLALACKHRKLGLAAHEPVEESVEPHECGVVFAAWKGHRRPLRHSAAGNLRHRRHEIWWAIGANSQGDALALLPRYVAARITALPVSEVAVP